MDKIIIKFISDGVKTIKKYEKIKSDNYKKMLQEQIIMFKNTTKELENELTDIWAADFETAADEEYEESKKLDSLLTKEFKKSPSIDLKSKEDK